jgi:drug/metabolite transporter (DMT)-like permease
MLLLAVIWGLSIPVTKLGLESLPPVTLTALRFAIAVPPLLLLTVGQKRMPLKAMVQAAGLGILGIGIGQLGQNLGVARTTASVATIISATIPLFTVVFAAFRLGQPVSLRQNAGLLSAFLGISLIALGQGGGAASLLDSSLAGVVILIVSAVAIAFYYVWSVGLTQSYGAVPVVTWTTLFGLLSLLPFAGIEMAGTSIAPDLTAWAAAAYLGLLVTVAGLFMWIRILSTVPAPVAAAIQYLQPIVGVAASAWLFGDQLDLSFAAGLALVLAGLALAVPPGRR